MEYLDLIMEYLIPIIRKSWLPEFLVLTLALGIFLYMASWGLGPPSDNWLRRLGIVLASFGITSIMMALILGVDLQFQLPENSSPPSSKERTSKYLKGQGQEPTETKVANGIRLEVGKRERQQEATRESLYLKDLPKGVWYEVNRWEGIEPKQTEVFNITSNQWLIGWETVPTGSKPTILLIKVYRADGTFICNAAKAMGEDLDRTFIRGSGTYYLVIDTAQKYTVFVGAEKLKHK